MKINILKSATEDLMRGFRFYEHQDTGLGNYFLDSLFADIDSLVVSSGMHGVHFGKHRLLAKRFPFAIYYTIEGDKVLVWAVLDCRQEPSKISQRLK